MENASRGIAAEAINNVSVPIFTTSASDVNQHIILFALKAVNSAKAVHTTVPILTVNVKELQVRFLFPAPKL